MLNIIASWIVQPMSMFVLCMTAVVLICSVRNITRAARGISLCFSLCLILLFSSPMFANFLVKHLEDTRKNPSWCEHDQTSLPVVVLGGGKREYVNSNSVYDILEASSLRRVAGAVNISNDKTIFYLLGGGSGRYKESVLMAEVLRDMGIPDNRILQETQSQSTEENASQLVRLLPFSTEYDEQGGKSANRIALVTSSIHVPRASKIFENQGFEVCHYATDVLYAEAVFPVSLMPYVGALLKTTDALHEILSYSLYRLKT